MTDLEKEIESLGPEYSQVKDAIQKIDDGSLDENSLHVLANFTKEDVFKTLSPKLRFVITNEVREHGLHTKEDAYALSKKCYDALMESLYPD